MVEISLREAIMCLNAGKEVICDRGRNFPPLRINSMDELRKAIEIQQRTLNDQLVYYKKDN